VREQQDAKQKDRQAEEMMRQMEAEYEAELASIKVQGARLQARGSYLVVAPA
jgi:hypothetical protein